MKRRRSVWDDPEKAHMMREKQVGIGWRRKEFIGSKPQKT